MWLIATALWKQGCSTPTQFPPRRQHWDGKDRCTKFTGPDCGTTQWCTWRVSPKNTGFSGARRLANHNARLHCLPSRSGAIPRSENADYRIWNQAGTWVQGSKRLLKKGAWKRGKLKLLDKFVSAISELHLEDCSLCCANIHAPRKPYFVANPDFAGKLTWKQIIAKCGKVVALQ